MGRDHQELAVFHKADELAVLVYRFSRSFPADERFGLRSQLRRATLSAATNIVEGADRDSRKDYLRFLDIALGSSAEAGYLLHVASRLEYMPVVECDDCRKRVLEIRIMLQKLITALRRLRG